MFSMAYNGNCSITVEFKSKYVHVSDNLLSPNKNYNMRLPKNPHRKLPGKLHNRILDIGSDVDTSMNHIRICVQPRPRDTSNNCTDIDHDGLENATNFS